MTEHGGEGDTGGDDALGLWVTIAELAEMRGLARQVMYRKVDRLIEQGALQVRTGKRGVKYVSPAEFDVAVGRIADLAREQGALTRRQVDADVEVPAIPASDGATYTREQARRMQYQADLSRLELEEKLGSLVRVDRLQAGVAACGAAIVQVLDRLPQASNDLAIAAAKDGEHGLRAALKALAVSLRADIATALTAIAVKAPAFDPASNEDGAGGADR